MSIIGKVQQIKQQIKNLEKEIYDIQDKCSHPQETLDISHRAYSDSDLTDTYWTDYRCYICDKWWTIQDKNK